MAIARDTRLSDNLVRLLGERGLTRRELARRTGITEATISRITVGLNNARLSTLREIKAELGCTWDELLE